MIAQIDLTVQAPELMDAYPGLKPDGSNSQLLPLYIEAQLAASKLKEQLHMSEDIHKVTVDHGYSIMDSLKYTSQFMLELLDDASKGYVVKNNMKPLIENRLADGSKISKRISKRIAANEHLLGVAKYIKDHDHDSIMGHICEELPDLPEYRDATSLINCTDVVMQNFFSVVAQENAASAVFSLDLFDMWRCANMKNTRSCFSIGGVYSRSVLAYALGGRVGVGYVCDKTGKPGGRFWIIFPENKKCFLFQPAYGFISPSVVATLGQYIAGMIDPKGTWKRIDLDTICVNEFKNRFTPYRDSSKYLYYEGEIQAGTAGYFDLVSAPDKCILCGMPHDEQGELICASCRSTKFTHCAVCGRSILASQGSTQICEKCIASKHICPKCGDIVSHDVCPKCAWENKCMICGSILGANALRTSLGDVCANCQTMLTATDCAVCGHKGLTYPHVETGTPLCMTCFRLVYMTGLEHVDFQSVNLDIKKKLMDLAVNNAIHNDYEGVGGIRHD